MWVLEHPGTPLDESPAHHRVLSELWGDGGWSLIDFNRKNI